MSFSVPEDWQKQSDILELAVEAEVAKRRRNEAMVRGVLCEF